VPRPTFIPFFTSSQAFSAAAFLPDVKSKAEPVKKFFGEVKGYPLAVSI